MRVPDFCGPSDRSQSLVANSSRTINWFPALLPRGSKSQIVLLPTPGQRPLLTVPEIGGRALFTLNDRTLAVMGPTVYGLDIPTATATSYGTVAQDENQAVITMNGTAGDEALISSGTNAYNLELATNVLTQVLTGDATIVGMLDGYGIAFDVTTGRIRLSDLNDFTTWDPTQFAGRSASPDTWVSMIVNAPDIFLIGSVSGDVWYDAGDFPFPFVPRPGATFKYGTPAPFSVASAGDSVLWLSQNAEGAGIVVQARGYTPQPIGSASVDARIAMYQRDFSISDAEGWCYQDEGHTFYNLRFPTAKACETYDVTTGMWHERGTWISGTNSYDVWRPRVHTLASGKHLVAESATGTISILDVNTGTEADGTEIRRERVTPSLFAEHKRVLIRRLEILIEMGLGTSTGQGYNPLITLETSDNGGKTYGNARQGSVGKIGRYSQSLIFNGMGMPRDRVHRLVASDPIPYRVIDAYVNNEGGIVA